MNLPNVCLLEGNHEKWLKDYGNQLAKSKEFEQKTKQLIAGGLMKKSEYMKITPILSHHF